MRKNLLKSLFLVTAAGLTLTACRNSDVEPTMVAGVGYYPLKLGQYIVYDVDSIYWNAELREEIPTRWQFRYDVSDTFRNANNELTFSIDIRKRKASTTAYQLEDVIHVTPFTDRIELKHSSLHYIAFKMPVEATTSWDGLSIIRSNPDIAGRYPEFSSDLWNYTYSNIGEDYDNEVLHWDRTVTLRQVDDEMGTLGADTTLPAHRFYGKEIYAHGVGLVEKELTCWYFDPLPPYGTGLGYRQGYSVKMKAVEHN